MKLSAAFEASIALSFGDVSDAYQFFPSTLGISDNPDYRANLQHCRITDIDYKRNHAGVSDHVPLLPVGRHYIGKDETVAIEPVNSRLRHWFARFRPVWCRKRSRWSTPPSHCLPPITSIEQRQNSPCHYLLNTLCSTTSIIKCRPIGCCSHRKAVERRNHKAFMAVTACCPLSGRALISL